MEELLFLAHRIPFPPDKGDKIRSFHVLRHLTRHYRVHIGAFIDDPLDWNRVDELRGICGDTHFVALRKRRATLRALSGLLTGRALTLPYYFDAGMARWIQTLLSQRSIGTVFVYSAAMAQYVESASHLRRVIDFVDVDSDKWRQYSASLTGPRRWIYRREADRLLRYERQVAGSFDAAFFVSAAEAQLFRRLAPEAAAKVAHYNNGVDLDRFSPSLRCDNPYPASERAIVFTGAMDYWPNVDAVVWFTREMLPLVRAVVPQAAFTIVGSNPSPEVQRLADIPGVRVTGRVEDVRPYLLHAAVAVAPLRLARGVQNKVLEAMACAKPTVVTPQALEGIDAQAGRHVVLADNAPRFADAVTQLLRAPDRSLGAAARSLVEAHYTWEQNLGAVLDSVRTDRRLSICGEATGTLAQTSPTAVS